jgi:peptide/nickel transport system permease protein
MNGLRAVLSRLFRSPTGSIGLLLAIFPAAAVVGALTLPLSSPTIPDIAHRLSPPTLSWTGLGAHPLGTDQLGRDILSRVLHGAVTTLSISCASVLLGAAVGILVGLASGYMGGLADRVLMRIADIQLALPLLLLALLVIAVLGPSLVNIVIVLALTGWIPFARITRGQVLSLREQEFILSARVIGTGPFGIMFRNILPNVISPILVVGTLEFARIILTESALGFLGLGVQPPAPSWGRMLSEGRGYMSDAWWVVLFPGLAISLSVMAVNFLGDFLGDFLDPKRR